MTLETTSTLQSTFNDRMKNAEERIAKLQRELKRMKKIKNKNWSHVANLAEVVNSLDTADKWASY